MRKKLQLHIPTPCHENWNEMKQVEQGKYCASCQKSVIDFTEMTDAQIISFFKKIPGSSVCGRLQDNQLNRNIAEPRKKFPLAKYFFRFTIPAFLISMRGEGQVGKIVPHKYAIASNQKNKAKMPTIITEMNGEVLDDEGRSMPYISIAIKGTGRSTLSDSVGQFSIKVRPADDIITIVASCAGFLPVEKIIDLSQYNPGTFVRMNFKSSQELPANLSLTSMNENPRMVTTFVGGLVATSIKVDQSSENLCIETSFTDWALSLFDRYSVYPNPVIAGNPITIENKRLKEDNYAIELVNLSGQTLQREIVFISGKQSNSIEIPSVSAGVYFIKLTSKKSGKVFSSKIIIQ